MPKERIMKTQKEWAESYILSLLGFMPTMSEIRAWLDEAAVEWECSLQTVTTDKGEGLRMQFNTPINGYTQISATFLGDDEETRMMRMFDNFINPVYGYFSLEHMKNKTLRILYYPDF